MGNRHDDFGRTGTLSGSTASDGLSPAWATVSADFAVASGTATQTTAASDVFALLGSGSADGTASITVANPGTSGAKYSGVLGRMSSDGQNGFHFFVAPNGAQLWRLFGGTWTQLGSTNAAVTPASGQVLALTCNGTAIDCKVNGTTAVSTTDTNFSANTYQGFSVKGDSAAGFSTYDFVVAGASDTTPPVPASAAIASGGGTFTATFTEAGSPPVLPASGVTGFTLSATGGALTLVSPTFSGTTLTATLSRVVTSAETVTWSYAPGNVTDSAASPNALASFGPTSVTNNSTQAPPLVAGSATSATVKVDVAASAASGGTGTITYQWYGSTTSGFTPGGGNLLSGQAAQNLAAYAVTPGSTYYFVRRATDSAGTPQTADTSQYTVSAVSSGGGSTGSRGRLVNA
jgi:hypothetical protein